MSQSINTTLRSKLLLAALSGILALPFIYGALMYGIDLTSHRHLYEVGAWFTNGAISIHMVFGALITLLAPIQVVLGWKRSWLKVHRIFGYVFVISSIGTSIAGLLYIFSHGSIGGMVMNVAFAIYGILMLLFSLLTIHFARQHDLVKHEEYAMRLFVLAVGSWFYRACYGAWFYTFKVHVLTTPDFRGPFDYFMDFAFFVIPLLLIEVYIRSRRTETDNPNPLKTTLITFLIAGFITYGSLGFYYLIFAS